jgi:hypothetical protein
MTKVLRRDNTRLSQKAALVMEVKWAGTTLRRVGADLCR